MFRKPNNVNQNVLHVWGNKESMNLNSMILTNIQASNYYKQKLSELKTYHEIIDEIYYRVNHLEPWEKGSRRTQGLTGMCGGVRGVGGGGIVSTCFCLLYKLYTLKLSKKQLIGLMNHGDSPYIRSLGFMYVRFTQNPQDLYSWYADYLDDEEEVDVKAGGGTIMQIGHMLRQWLTRLEWYDTLFPRIPVPIQNEIMFELRNRYGDRDPVMTNEVGKRTPPSEMHGRDRSRDRSRNRSRDRSRDRSRNRSKDRSKDLSRSKDRSRERSRSPRHRSRNKSRNRSPKRKSRSNSSSRHNHRSIKNHRSKSNSSSERSTASSKESSRHRRHRHHKKSSSHKNRETSQERNKRRHRKSSKRHDDEDSERKRHHKRSHRNKERSRSREASRNRDEEKRVSESSDSANTRKESKIEYLKKYRDDQD